MSRSFAQPDGYDPPRSNVDVDRQVASGRGFPELSVRWLGRGQRGVIDRPKRVPLRDALFVEEEIVVRSKGR